MTKMLHSHIGGVGRRAGALLKETERNSMACSWLLLGFFCSPSIMKTLVCKCLYGPIVATVLKLC